MRRHTAHIVPLAALVLLTGCRDFTLPTEDVPGTVASSVVAAEPDEPFVLEPGQSARMEALALSIALVQVTSDTRCVPDPECSENGSAQVIVELRRDGGSRVQYVLSIPGNVGVFHHYGDLIQDGDEGFRLLRLEPYPGLDGPADPRDYAATLIVQRSS